MSFCGTVVYALYGHKLLVPTEASCHKPEPGLAAAPQRRHTMSVGSCLGDYNQATWEPAQQHTDGPRHRWITQLRVENVQESCGQNGLCRVNTQNGKQLFNKPTVAYSSATEQTWCTSFKCSTNQIWSYSCQIHLELHSGLILLL